MNKPKAQGTALETREVGNWRSHGIPAGRLAEGGCSDLGDVWLVEHPDGARSGDGWICEAKWRANLNPHQALAKAIKKAGHLRTFLVHKRLVDKGGKRRVPDGLVQTVTLHPDTFSVLLQTYELFRQRHPRIVDDIWEDLRG